MNEAELKIKLQDGSLQRLSLLKKRSYQEIKAIGLQPNGYIRKVLNGKKKTEKLRLPLNKDLIQEFEVGITDQQFLTYSNATSPDKQGMPNETDVKMRLLK